MMKKAVLVGLVVLAVILSGCGPATETPTPDLGADYVPVVAVTGEVVPAVWATVSAQASGTVLEVLVEPGDEVTAGDLLVQLEPTDAQLAVQEAEAALTSAQARLALLQAAPLSEEIAVAEAEIEVTQAALSQAAAQRDQLRAGATEAEIAAVQAQVTAAQADQLVAEETHDQTMKCFSFKMGGKKKTICPALGAPEEQARYNLQAADETLEAVQVQLDALEAGAGDKARAADAAVLAATAQQGVAEAELDLLRAGPTAEEVAAQKAAVAQAQAALDAARVALERTEVRAPLAGAVGMVDVRTGELVAAGQPLITMGDLSTLQVETTDLDEIDVARVAVGQQVDVTFDAIPGQVFDGRVARISPMAESGDGGVNYTVVIELPEIAPAIRWGMTAFVDIEVER
jgi:HlyD family secretion protein